MGPLQQPETLEDAEARNFLDVEFLRKLENLRLIAKRLSWASAKGEHASSRKGSSLEFADYRRYQRGDDLRYVDWNVYRRLDRLLLKVFTAEEEMNVYLLVDASRSMAAGSPPKLEYAKRVAAALGYIGLKNLDRVGGAAFAADLGSPLSLARGRKQILALFQFLSKLTCGGETDLRATARAFVRLFPHPGLLVLVSDLLDPEGWRPAIEELARRKHQLLIIHVLDAQEMKPPAPGDVSLLDIERARMRRCFIDPDLVRRYQAELERYIAEIESVCSNRQIDYLRTTTDVPFEEFVLKTLSEARSVA
ncbi:MAG TPA: DUF58 domain-containing protein [Candidatus Eisenbacteria bacterium]|nr:DUF58 domain-containing protein [Candidatus Eisenbacteria bacterium]